MNRLEQLQHDLCRLVLEKHHQENMAQRHIAIETWLEALGMIEYYECFRGHKGVEDLLYLSEAEIRDMGLRNAAHRAKLVSSLRILREKYERSTLPGRRGPSMAQMQRSHSATAQLSWTPPSLSNHPDYQVVNIAPERLQHDLLAELQGDPSELKCKAWYHGSISRQHAEKLVTKNGDFLVRDCISQPGDFVLTCCWKNVPLHFVINSTVTENGTSKLPSVTYHFEDIHFPSVQDLIQTYMHECTQITENTGAVITSPIGRTMPLSYYDMKYRALSSSVPFVNHYAQVQGQSPMGSPNSSPQKTPQGSPQSVRSKRVERSGSQPLLSMDDEGRARTPPMDRSDSLPIIAGIYKQITPNPQHKPPPHPSGYVHHRSGSAPVLTPVVNVTQHFDNAGSPANLTPATSDSDLHKSPPPKPSRIPSVKYKQRPQVVVRNIALYDDDRDYSDYGQVKSEPSWVQKDHGKSQTANHSSENLTTANQHGVDGNMYDNNMNSKARLNRSCDDLSDVNRNIPPLKKYHSSSDTYSALDKDYSDIPKFPVDNEMLQHQHVWNNNNKNSTQLNHSHPEAVTVKIPKIETEMSFDVRNYRLKLLPDENRLLEPSTLINVRNLILGTDCKILAQHLTAVELELLLVMNEEDLGVCVQSGLELITLPQGKQLRQDIMERVYCLKAFVMVMTLTCATVIERAHMLSQWIQVAMELKGTLGNLFGFEVVMEGLMSDQIQRLRDTWMVLRQNHTSSAFKFDTKLKSSFRMLKDGSDALPVQDICIPNVIPLVQLLEREENDQSYLPWELSNDFNTCFDIMLIHLDMARMITAQCGLYRIQGQMLMKNVTTEEDKLEIFRTQFHLRFLWGFKGAGVERTERQNKFNMLLTAYSEKIERTGDDGTEV